MKTLTLTFSFGEDDWKHFTSFYINFNPKIKKWQRETFCYYMLMPFIIYGLATMFSDKNFALLLFGVAYAGIFISTNFNPYKKILKHYSSSILPNYFLPNIWKKTNNNSDCNIIINSDAFIFRSFPCESKWGWDFFDDVILEEAMIFIIQAKIPLFFIPRRIFKNEDDFKRCYDTLNKLIIKDCKTGVDYESRKIET